MKLEWVWFGFQDSRYEADTTGYQNPARTDEGVKNDKKDCKMCRK